jgi:hypothetical protein
VQGLILLIGAGVALIARPGQSRAKQKVRFMLIRLAALCAVLASPLLADCVDFDTVTKGVTVTQADGSIWTVRRGAHDTIRMDQTNAAGVYAKYAEGPYGVYPTETTRNGIGGTAEYTFAKAPPEPGIGMGWTSTYKVNDIPHQTSRGRIGGGARRGWRRRTCAR